MQENKKQIYSKLVYIHELDSVRSSEAEIKHARSRLYEEILINGNTPVISFNQLADSKAFIGLVIGATGQLTATDNDNSDFSDIGYLMRHGRIKIARFSDKRTASQYLQDNLDAKKTNPQSKFILSGWPIPKDLENEIELEIYECIRLALRNSDPNYIDSRLSSLTPHRNNVKTESVLTAEQIRQIKQLIVFVLSISKTDFAYADISKEEKPSLSQLIYCIRQGLMNGEMKIKEPFCSVSETDIQEACEILDSVHLNENDLDRRSAWYNQMPSIDNTTSSYSYISRALAHRVVDLCYNITVESGIDKCSSPFSSFSEKAFNKEVGKKLSQYMRDFESYKPSSSEIESEEDDPRPNNEPSSQIENSAQKLDWGLLVNIQRAIENRFRDSRFDCRSGADGSDLSKQRSIWKRNVYGSFAFQTWGAILYVILFGFIEVVLSLIDGLMENALSSMISSDALGVEDLLTFNRILVVTFVFIAGVILYAVSTSGEKQRSIKVPIIGISLIFFILLPVITCVEIHAGTNAALSIRFDPSDFLTNFLLVLPSMLVGFIGVLAFAIIGSLLEDRTGLPGLFDSMKLTKDSFVDSLKFALITNRFTSSNCESIVLEDEANNENKMDCSPSDSGAWSWLQSNLEYAEASSASISDATTYNAGNWNDYAALVRKHDKGHENDQKLKIILDEDLATTIANNRSENVGIIHDSPYNTLVVDVVEDQNENRFTYERLIPKNTGAVVIVPCYKGKYIMLKQYRHAIRDYQICFPRGFGEKDVTASENVVKELSEEIGATGVSHIRKLGELTPDSGISSNIVSVFSCEIERYDSSKRDEGVSEILEIASQDLYQLIQEQKITDGFSLAALTMYQTADGSSCDKLA